MSKEYYLWTRDHIRLEKVIGAHEVEYLADDLCQTMTEMIQTIEDIMTIKEFKNYETPITLKKLKEKLFLVKDKKEAR